MRSRWFWAMSPLRAAAECPRASKRSAKSTVAVLVRTKIIEPSIFSSASKIRVKASNLCPPLTIKYFCLMVVAVAVFCLIMTSTGLLR